jgi:SAM-dependent methyltransferase
MPERIPEETWRSERDHVARYEWAAGLIRHGEIVLDIACGIGYGAELLAPRHCRYLGVDKPGASSPTFACFGAFVEADIERWEPPGEFDVALCFETLEHVPSPDRLAAILGDAGRLVLLSVPTVPTVGENPWHLHDFTVDDIPPLFPDWVVAERWEQPDARSHVWAFARP